MKKKYPVNHTRQKALVDKLVNYVAGSLAPLSTVDSADFRALMQEAEPKFQMPSRKHVSSVIIHAKLVDKRDAVCHQLQSASAVCLTSHQMRSYLGITGHILRDWKMILHVSLQEVFRSSHS